MRKYFVLLILLLLPVLYVASGAFTSTSAQRSAEIAMAGDASALVGLAPSENANGAYFQDTDGNGTYELDIMSVVDGVNTNAVTVLQDVFTITNNGTQAIFVSIEALGPHPEAISFGDLDEGVTLAVGALAIGSVTIDTHDIPAGESIIQKMIITASADGQQSSAANTYAPVLSVIDDRLFDDGNSANIVGTVPAADTPFDWSKTFDGDDDYVVVPNQASYNPTQAITLEAWIRWDIDPETGAPWANIINKSEHQYQLQHSGYTSEGINQYFEFALETTNGRKFLFSNTAPQVGEWYHVVSTYSAADEEMRIYVNGELEASKRQTGEIDVTDFDINIGRHAYDYRYYEGTVAEVAIYDRALTDEEIAGLTKRYLDLLI